MRNFLRLNQVLAAAALMAFAAGTAQAAISKDAGDDTFSGSYLAGRNADQQRDMNSAIGFYRSALKFQPDNSILTERLLLLTLTKGDMPGAVALAQKLVGMVDDDAPARLVLAVQAFKAGHPDEASSQLDKIEPSELSTITVGLFRAWMQFGAGKVDDAVKTVTALSGPDWYSVFKDLQTARILDAAGRPADAVAPIKRAYASNSNVRAIVLAYARILGRAGQRDEAIRAVTALGGDNPHSPATRQLLAELKSDAPLAPAITSAAGGIAETLFNIGLVIGTDDGPELPAAYLRLSSYVAVGDYAAVVATGDVFQSVGRCDEAVKLYEQVPASLPIRRDADLEAGACLARLGQTDAAAKLVTRVVDADPTDIDAVTQLGDIYRGAKRLQDAVTAYTRGIDAVKDPAIAGWGVYFDRAIAYTGLNQWPPAEADLKQSLALNPDQPEVLNYLGYSWVDRKENLDDALTMIKKAVSLHPNDGLIIDSLGWAYHRLGRDSDAVSELESAVEQPDGTGGDPIVNDHLGDVYWALGRKREAYFQWSHARDYHPDKSDLPRIMAKLQGGLDKDGNPVAPINTKMAAAAQTVTVAAGDSLWSIAQRALGDPKLYYKLYQANRHDIADPDAIYPGMQLTLPPTGSAD
ncbi:MAG TPA: tetratricopeptide repeat protein [Bauldia sp.]|nr:tetratricopeptide repeat protein [Bauldia sp.]